MKIGMQTWGSHGDIRPFLALAEGLQTAGHDVTLVITCVDSAAYAGITSAAGVQLRIIASPVIAPDEAERIGAAAVRMRNPMTQVASLMDHCYLPAEEPMFVAARQLSTECDVLIGHYFLHPLHVAAEHAGKPYVSIVLSHAAVPSACNCPVNHPFGRAGNRFLWWLTRTAMQRALSRYSNRLRKRMNLPLVRDVVNEVWLSRRLTLVGVSPAICARQPDWLQAVQVTGFLDMPNMPLEGDIGAELAAFLAAGEAPVYMTTGSWMPRDIALQSNTLQLFTQAARLAGCRAIIQSRDAQACGFTSDNNILYIGAAPHHAVFPRCRAVVHHGGAGTTQSVTLAGMPSVVLAHISEQEHWGRELQRLGCAGKPLHVRSVTPRKLAARITEVLQSPSMAQQAQAVARAMAQENGVAAAVRIIGETFGREGRRIAA